MALTVRKLVTVWGFDVEAKPLENAGKAVGNLKKKVSEAGKSTQVSLNKVSSAISKNAESMALSLDRVKSAAVQASVGVAAAAGAVYVFANSTAQLGADVLRTSEKIGLGSNSLQEYRYAARKAGIELDTLDDSLQTFVELSSEAAAKGTGSAAEALNELGISLRDGSGNLKDTDTLLSEVADGMQGLTDDAQRLRLHIELFGDEGSRMVNVTKNGAAGLALMKKEAHDLGYVISPSKAKEAEAYANALGEMGAIFIGIRNEVGGKLLGVLTRVTEKWKTFILENRKAISLNITQFLDKVIVGLDWLGDVLVTGAQYTGYFLDKVGGLEPVLRTVAVALGVVASSMLLVNLPLILVSAGIAALTAAVAILLEDLWSFAEGADSVTGGLIDSFKNWFETLEDSPVKQFLASLLSFFKALDEYNPFDRLVRNAKNLIDEFVSLGTEINRNPIFKLLKAAGSSVLDFALKQSSGALEYAASGLRATVREENDFDRFITAANPAYSSSAASVIPRISPATHPIGGSRSSVDKRSYQSNDFTIQVTGDGQDREALARTIAEETVRANQEAWERARARNSIDEIER